jgi:hypothetical protein
MRVSVIGANIAVEINGKHVMTFDLDEMTHTDGTSYKRLTPGDILLSYASAVAGNSASIRLLELWAEHKSLMLLMGVSTSGAIKKLCDRWAIRSRATQTGGLEFSSFTSRDDAGTLQKSLQTHAHTGDDGHDVTMVMVTGEQSGMYIDAANMAAEGFAFKTSSNSDAATVQESNEAAQSVARESVEFATQETVNTTARTAAEVEDKVTLTYAPGGDAPAFASADFVITALTTTYGEKVDTERFDLRRYIVW